MNKNLVNNIIGKIQGGIMMRISIKLLPQNMLRRHMMNDDDDDEFFKKF